MVEILIGWIGVFCQILDISSGKETPHEAGRRRLHTALRTVSVRSRVEIAGGWNFGAGNET